MGDERERKREAHAATPEDAPADDDGKPPARATRARPNGRSLLLAGGHLAALWAIAVAQPLFDLLGQNPDFFAVRGSTPREIVLFTLALAFLPPAALLALEAAAGLVDRRLAQALHLLFVAALAGLIVLQAANRAVEGSGAPLLAVAALAGVAVAVAYARLAAARFATTVLLPAPFLVLGLFLFNSPVSELLTPPNVEIRAARVESTTPVVLVVFDELPTVSLLNGRGRVDASRYPNFAALARKSTWYRNATTVSPDTTKAVPAILTGKVVAPDQLPGLADHPDNIFTLLGGDYELRVAELATRLCPPDLCETIEDGPVGGRFGSLGLDIAAVYLHVVTPDHLAHRLPPVGETWSDFFGGGAQDDREVQPSLRGDAPLPACLRGVCRFAQRIGPTRRPGFFFYHGLLPHVPWIALPSGRRYFRDVEAIPGTTPGPSGPAWEDQPALIQQGYQRHLLQLGYADRALGVILDRLRDAGLYDSALVVVTADHGASFEPLLPRRIATPETLASIAFVPLFVKLPDQEEPRVEDGFARTVDIVPTIADALGTELPWPTDGRSLLGRRLPRDETVVVTNPNGSEARARLSALLRERADAVSRQLDWFGAGNGWDGVYALGPNPDLIGTDVSAHAVVQTDEGVEVAAESFFRAVDPASGVIPAYVRGTLQNGPGSGTRLAIAVNGRIAAVTETYARDGERFSAMLPDDALREGRNDVRVYGVPAGTPETLAQLQGATLAYTLEGEEGSERIAVSDGSSIAIGETGLRGEASVRPNGPFFTFRGWAFDADAGRGAERLLVFSGSEAVFDGPSGNLDPRAFAPGGVSGRAAGFRVDVVSGLVPDPGSGTPVRVFAVSEGVATELAYDESWRWPTR